MNPRYAPWCSRSCQRFHQRKGQQNPDAAAKRIVYLTNSEAKRLTAELEAARRQCFTLSTQTLEDAVTIARLTEELYLYRHLAYSDLRDRVNDEILRRNRDGRSADDSAQSAVIETNRNLSLGRLSGV